MKPKVRYEFSQRLQNLVGKELKIRINDNRSTMLHVRWKKGQTHVSLHRMFLDAPRPVQQALASYIRRDDKCLSPAVKAYIDQCVPHLDYSHLLDPEQMTTCGEVYNLQTLYNRVNRRYFADRLDLSITWFGQHRPWGRTKCTLGLYIDAVKLVKISRLLDSPRVPSYVVEYVIYHEMVHAICPAYVDENGRNRIHSKEFRAIERRYLEFDQAEAWLKANRTNLFFRRG